MPKEPWARNEQDDFLHARMVDYREAQLTKNYAPFWSRLYEDWFAKWPEENELFPDKVKGEELTSEQETALGLAQKARRAKLQTWYRYRTSTTLHKRAAVATKKIATLHARTRLPQKQELFAQLYKDTIQPAIADALKAENAVTPAEKLAVIKRVQKEAYMSSSDEVKKEVENALAEIASEKASLKEKKTEYTPKEYQNAINECPSILRQMMEALAERTGWSFTILMGGPEPQNRGTITSWSFHYGENMLGNSFNDAHPTFEHTYMGPYNEFLERVYPDSVRRSRSLEEGKDKVDNGVDTSRSENGEEGVVGMTSPSQESDSIDPDLERANELVNPTPPTDSDADGLTNNVQDETRPSSTSGNQLISSPSGAVPSRPSVLSDSDSLQHDASFDASITTTPGVPNLGYPPAYFNASFDASRSAAATIPSNRLMTSLSSAVPAGPDGSHSSPSYASMPVVAGLPSSGYPHGYLNAETQNTYGDNFLTFDGQPADMGVDLDPFGSAQMDGASGQTDWWMDDSLFAMLSAPDLPVLPLPQPVNENQTMQMDGSGYYYQFKLSEPEGSIINQTPTQDQSATSESVQISLPSHTNNVKDSSQSQGALQVEPVNKLSSQDVHSQPASDSSTTHSPDAVDPLAPTLNQKSSEGPGIQKLSKSGRAIIPSTRLEKMNEIGTNKENVPLIATSAKANNEWADNAKKYLSGLELGEDWKACIDAWIRIEESMGYGKGSKGMLSSADRPQEWKAWTSKGRSGSRPYHIKPVIVDGEEFGLACIGWWNKLQPPFRRNEQVGTMPLSIFIPPDAEALSDAWEPLRKGGPNGLVVVLILFSWWGQTVQEGCGTGIVEQWRAALMDLRRTLEAIGTTAQKRAAPALQASNKRQRHK